MPKGWALGKFSAKLWNVVNFPEAPMRSYEIFNRIYSTILLKIFDLVTKSIKILQS